MGSMLEIEVNLVIFIHSRGATHEDEDVYYEVSQAWKVDQSKISTYTEVPRPMLPTSTMGESNISLHLIASDIGISESYAAPRAYTEGATSVAPHTSGRRSPEVPTQPTTTWTASRMTVPAPPTYYMLLNLGDI